MERNEFKKQFNRFLIRVHPRKSVAKTYLQFAWADQKATARR